MAPSTGLAGLLLLRRSIAGASRLLRRVHHVSEPLIPFYEKRSKLPVHSDVHRARSARHSELIYGVHSVELALASRRRQLYRVFVRDQLWTAEPAALAERNPAAGRLVAAIRALDAPDKRILSNAQLGDLVNQRPHQGFVLECGPLPMPLLGPDGLGAPTDGAELVLFLDRVCDVMNLGSVLRSAAFFGVTRVLLPATASAAPIPVVSKVSSGGAELVELFRLEQDGAQALESMRRLGWHLLATGGAQPADGAAGPAVVPLHQLKLPSPDASVVLLLGSEGTGLSPSLMQLCSRVVRIARPSEDGLFDHLNVGVAAALLLYGVRQAQSSAGQRMTDPSDN